MKSRLGELRKRRLLTQNGLGMKLGVSQQNISRYEREPFSIPVDMLIKLADFFHVTTDYLLGISEVMQSTGTVSRKEQLQEKDFDLLEVYRMLEKREKEIVWAVVEVLLKSRRE